MSGLGELINGKTISIQKKCSCGAIHTHLPENTIKYAPFYWFNCACGSTLVVKIQKE